MLNVTGNGNFNPAVPGPIGNTTPSSGKFTTAQSTTPVDALTAGVAQFKSGSWTPTANSLTVVGAPTYTGTYIRVGGWVQGTLTIIAATSTASVANTSFFGGLPYSVATKGVAPAVRGDVLSLGEGLVDTSGGNPVIFTPTWTATGLQVTINFGYFTGDAF